MSRYRFSSEDGLESIARTIAGKQAHSSIKAPRDTSSTSATKRWGYCRLIPLDMAFNATWTQSAVKAFLHPAICGEMDEGW